MLMFLMSDGWVLACPSMAFYPYLGMLKRCLLFHNILSAVESPMRDVWIR